MLLGAMWNKLLSVRTAGFLKLEASLMALSKKNHADNLTLGEHKRHGHAMY